MRSDVWQAWRPKIWQRILDHSLSREEMLHLVSNPFLVKAMEAQRPPLDRDWRTWLFMGGRGAGKTRAGAEWLRYAMMHGGCRRAALVGPTLLDVREVMIEGPSGLRAVTPEMEDKPVYEVSRRRLVWPNGAEGHVFSAEDADSLRGPQFDVAWCDEIAAWPKAQTVWDMLQMALRLGDDPRAVATTTPRPVPLIKRLVRDPHCVLTRAGTADNAANLAPGFLGEIERAYAGTRLGRQELDGELIEDMQGALWTRSVLEIARLGQPPKLDDVVVAVDPPATSGPKADACGIVAVGMIESADGKADRAVVLADGSEQGLSPLDWASRASAMAVQFGAGRVVAEANQGGEMVRHALETAGCTVPVRLVNARAGKRARASPVAALYEAGRVQHVGVMKALEDEMCSFGADGFSGSPDRVDALVWGVRALLLDRAGAPRVRGV
ncbi:MAG: terminase family protein [Hyphomonadaceae bacterium]